MPSRAWKLAVLVVAGTVFYSFWDVRFVTLLYAAALIDYIVALRLAGSRYPRRWLVVSLCFNLGVLAIFKYAVFVADNARSVFDLLGIPIEFPYFSIVLPIGISFFTFKTLSYTIDVYRGEVPATTDFLRYLAFILLFPDLVAGPIVRYKTVSTQFDELPTRLSSAAVGVGLSMLAIGLFKKVAIADTLARTVDPLWSDVGAWDTWHAWIAVLGYTLQLYFDFSGYSDMAIGLAALLGLAFPINFRAPYKALNPSDFWRRWHISLSGWLRDYLYIPLGGNRAPPWRVRFNLLLVMSLGGLWHGAAWTFVLWGVYHGALLVLYKETAPTWDKIPVAVQRGLMIVLVALGWVLFRAPDLGTAWVAFRALFGAATPGVLLATPAKLFLVTLGVASALALFGRSTSEMRFSDRLRHVAFASFLFVAALVLMSNSESPFLYYQF